MKYNLCDFCNNPKKRYKNNTYAKTCGNNECITKQRKTTNIEKYGHECNLHSKAGKRKVKKTLKRKYGKHITNVSQIQEVKQRKMDTCFNNFGVAHPMQSSEIMEKSIKTLMSKYGVDNISKLEETIKKIQEIKNTPTDKFFGLTPIQFGMIKIKEYNMKKFGVEYYFQTDDFKEKYKTLMIERYGVDNFFKSDTFADMMITQGFRYSNEDLKKIEDYRRAVRIYTERSYLEFKRILESDFKRSNAYHLDHIYSISEGFKKNINPEIIGSICNLQILPSKINTQKSGKCWITKKELLKRYQTIIK